MHYNYKEPEKIPSELHQTFDFVVIDPPFITEEVWSLYAQAAKLLLKPGTMTRTISRADYDRMCLGLANAVIKCSPLIATDDSVSSSSSKDSTPSSQVLESASNTSDDEVTIVEPIGKVLASTVPENWKFLESMLNLWLCSWRPSIPNLIYQYSLYTSYASKRFSVLNPEIDSDDYDIKQLFKVVHSSRKTTSYGGFGSSS